MKKQQILALLLALLLTTTACGTTEPPAETTADTTAPLSTETEAGTETEVQGKLPARDFGGETFTVYTRSAPDTPQFHSYEISSEEVTGDVLNDAVYNRNLAVEEKYNLLLEEIKFAEPGDEAIKAAQTGDTVLDYVVSPGYSIYPSVTSGALFDLYTAENFHFDLPWWHETINDSLSIRGKMFLAMNDYLLLYKQQSYCLFYNKDMATDYGLDNYYDIVFDGKFTWDKVYDDMKVVSNDLDGDGDMDQLDNYGFTCQYGQMIASIISCDLQFTSKDSDDTPILDINSPKHNEALDKLVSIFIDKSTTLLANDYSKSETTGKSMWDIPIDTFYDDRVLFLGGVVRYAPSIVGNCDVDFGILPNPKLNESQQDYYTYSETGNSTVISIPVSADLEKSSFVIEAMSEESWRTVVPAYYETTLKSKYSPDPMASTILDMMFANHRFDAVLLYAWMDVSGMYNTILQKKENTFASQYASKSGAAETKLQDWLEDLADLQ